jgi:hypothetical protein
MQLVFSILLVLFLLALTFAVQDVHRSLASTLKKWLSLGRYEEASAIESETETLESSLFVLMLAFVLATVNLAFVVAHYYDSRV